MFLLQMRLTGFYKIVSGPLPLKNNIIINYLQNIHTKHTKYTYLL